MDNKKIDNNKCIICDEIFNKKIKKICCMYCNFEACNKCSKQYILSQTYAKCMNNECNKEWNLKFIKNNFNDKISKTEFKNHAENMLYEQEKALMPSTQYLVEEYIFEKQTKKEINEIEKKIIELNHQKNNLERLLIINKNNDEKEIYNYSRKCNFIDCRGFLNNNWFCSICKNTTCNKCHEIKNTDVNVKHECDPNLVKTAEMIEKETKPCPKCQTKIFKISGCNQMWCTQCHTAFNWITGKLEKKIHNPHYFEWQRNNPTNETKNNDFEIFDTCQNELSHYTINLLTNIIIQNNHELYFTKNSLPVFLTKKNNITNFISNGTYGTQINTLMDNIFTIIRNNIHNADVELEKFSELNSFELNKNLRIKYMSNEINEKKFKIAIQQNNKKNKKNKEIFDVLTLSITVATDIIYRIIEDFKNKKPFNDNFDDLSNELQEIRKHCNILFLNISKDYNSIRYYLSELFYFRKFIDTSHKIK
jgi:hypothetical protein